MFLSILSIIRQWRLGFGYVDLNRDNSIQIHHAHMPYVVFIPGFNDLTFSLLLSEHICNPAFILFESSSCFIMQD